MRGVDGGVCVCVWGGGGGEEVDLCSNKLLFLYVGVRVRV